MSGEYVLESSASHLLHRAQQLAASQSAEALKSAGITLRQFSVLVAISDSEGASQADIVSRTGIDRSTLADMAARLEDRGFVKRKPAKHDARAKALTLMAKGRKALEKTRAAVAEADETILAALPQNRRSSFLGALSKLADVDSAPAPAPKLATKTKAKAAKPKKKAGKAVKKKKKKKAA